MNVTFELFVGEWGAASVTAGGFVSTKKLTGALAPSGLPIELGCFAMALYCPLFSVWLAPPEVQAAPVPAAVAVATTFPAIEPS